MSSVKSSVKLGTAARSMALLGGLGVNEGHVQATIDNPIQRAIVASAYRGDVSIQVSFEDILAREIKAIEVFHEIAVITPNFVGVDDEQIERALRQLEAKKGSVTVNDRFIPDGLTLEMLFQFIYNWNTEREKSGETPLKLYYTQNKEWWRTDKEVTSIPTQTGILTCDFNTVMRTTDIAGRPFNLNMDEQITWAKEQGGVGIMSAEKVVYLFIRSLIENRLPLWNIGSVRCSNSSGHDGSLGVGFCVGNGFYVDTYQRTNPSWCLGAFPEISNF